MSLEGELFQILESFTYDDLGVQEHADEFTGQIDRLIMKHGWPALQHELSRIAEEMRIARKTPLEKHEELVKLAACTNSVFYPLIFNFFRWDLYYIKYLIIESENESIENLFYSLGYSYEEISRVYENHKRRNENIQGVQSTFDESEFLDKYEFYCFRFGWDKLVSQIIRFGIQNSSTLSVLEWSQKFSWEWEFDNPIYPLLVDLLRNSPSFLEGLYDIDRSDRSSNNESMTISEDLSKLLFGLRCFRSEDDLKGICSASLWTYFETIDDYTSQELYVLDDLLPELIKPTIPDDAWFNTEMLTILSEFRKNPIKLSVLCQEEFADDGSSRKNRSFEFCEGLRFLEACRIRYDRSIEKIFDRLIKIIISKL